MNEQDKSWRAQGRADGLYDEQLQRVQQEKKLFREEAKVRTDRMCEEVE